MTRRRLARTCLASLCVAGVAATATADAHAAPPEMPETSSPESVAATSATFKGVLNATTPGELGSSYQFLYKASATQCEGANGAPEPPAPAFGGEHEEVAEAVGGLSPHTTYTVCLLERNAEGEATVGAPVTFTTALPPEPPETLEAASVTGSTATLRGVLNPNAPGEAGTYEFLYRASATECKGEGERTAPEPVGTALGGEREAVSVEVAGLLPTTQYTFCLLGRNQAGEVAVGAPKTFTTPAASPTVGGVEISGVGAGAATLSAQIAPGGLSAVYHFDYGPSLPYAASTAALTLPASPTAVGVQEQLTGLAPGTLYHVRVVATNALGTAAAADTTFTTVQTPRPSQHALPDGRAYELVSAADAEVYFAAAGFPVGDISGLGGAVRAAAGGDAATYLGDPPSSGSGGGTGKTGGGAGNEYLARRGPAGWQAADVEPSVDHESLMEFASFSADLSLAIARTNYPIAAEPAAPAECLAKRRPAFYSYAAGAFHALPAPPGQCGGSRSAGMSADRSHVLLPVDEGALYDAVGGRLYRVDVPPSGEPSSPPNATFGGGMQQATFVGRNDFSNTISADGGRVFWTDLATQVTPEDPAGTTRLFMRTNDTRPQSPLGEKGECTQPADACTVQVDAAQGGSGSSGGGRFWTASDDGARVFFTDCSRLTPDSTAVSGGGCGETESPTGNDLYEYDVSSGRLTDLTVDATAGDPLGANVQGVVGVSGDGAYAYFVATGVLAGGANAEGREPVAGQPNLYLRHDGATVFVGALSGADNGPFVCPGGSQCGDWVGDPGVRTAQVAPAGHRVAFTSTQPLTGYDSRGMPEVFLYDPDSARLSCASCDPNGAPPVAMTDETDSSFFPVKRGAFVTLSDNSTFSTRWINEDGTELFFNTSQALVPQDTNGRLDVYEWESDGAGSCRQEAGCTYLLSSGTSPNRAQFLDASASGRDAFFIARADLVPRASGELAKLYDARVGGGFSEASLACTGSGCPGVPAAPAAFAPPATAVFNGAGNFAPTPVKPGIGHESRAQGLAKALKACRAKRSRRRRAACTRRARRLYGPTSKASRRASRSRKRSGR